MKKSKITIIAILIGVITAACLLACILKNRLDSDRLSGDDDYSPIGEDDYIDDLDIPELSLDSSREEKAPAKIRRGYIPIRLGRD